MVHIPSDFLASVSDYDLTGSLIGDKVNSVIFDNSKLKRAVPGFTATVRADQGHSFYNTAYFIVSGITV